jgi:hypothetical protein
MCEMQTATMTLLLPDTPRERELFGRFYLDYGRQLLEGGEQAGAVPPPGGEPSAYAGENGEQNLRRLVSEVHGEKARLALRAIADQTLEGTTAPDSDTIRNRLGMETGEGVPNKLGGVLTSVGFAIKRTGLPRPYTERWGGDRQTYVMPPEVAELMRSLLDTDGSLK